MHYYGHKRMYCPSSLATAQFCPKVFFCSTSFFFFIDVCVYLFVYCLAELLNIDLHWTTKGKLKSHHRHSGKFHQSSHAKRWGNCGYFEFVESETTGNWIGNPEDNSRIHPFQVLMNYLLHAYFPCSNPVADIRQRDKLITSVKSCGGNGLIDVFGQSMFLSRQTVWLWKEVKRRCFSGLCLQAFH